MEGVALPEAMIDALTPVQDWVIVLPIVLALMGAAGLLMVRRLPGLPVIGAALVVLAIIACEITLLLRVSAEGPISMTMGRWLPPFGISLTVDVFSAVFALAASVVTLMVLVYAESERTADDARDGFHPMVLLLLAGVTGSFLTSDLFNLYVWFEVMLIASFGLLVLGGRPLQLDGAVKYGFLNFLATTIFLLSLGLLQGLLGTLNMADILRLAPSADPAAMTGVAALMLLAFGMKAAVFPVNTWLPASYHTPSAAVSALFAALLTKVGAYAMLRTLVVVLPASRDILEPTLLVLAIATLVIAPLGAIAETNLRRAIGFLVVGGIGAVMVGIGLPSADGVAGAGAYIFHAILTMAALYMTAGMIEQKTGATDTRDMGGLYAASAPVSVLFFLLILAAAGVPPLLGFWPKLLLLEAGIAASVQSWLGTATVVALLVNAVLTLIAGTRLWAHIFWRPAPATAAIAPSRKMAIAPTALLAAAVVAIGLWPAPLLDSVRTGTADMLDPGRYIAATGLAGAEP